MRLWCVCSPRSFDPHVIIIVIELVVVVAAAVHLNLTVRVQLMWSDVISGRKLNKEPTEREINTELIHLLIAIIIILWDDDYQWFAMGLNSMYVHLFNSMCCSFFCSNADSVDATKSELTVWNVISMVTMKWFNNVKTNIRFNSVYLILFIDPWLVQLLVQNNQMLFNMLFDLSFVLWINSKEIISKFIESFS